MTSRREIVKGALAFPSLNSKMSNQLPGEGPRQPFILRFFLLAGGGNGCSHVPRTPIPSLFLY